MAAALAAVPQVQQAGTAATAQTALVPLGSSALSASLAPNLLASNAHQGAAAAAAYLGADPATAAHLQLYQQFHGYGLSPAHYLPGEWAPRNKFQPRFICQASPLVTLRFSPTQAPKKPNQFDQFSHRHRLNPQRCIFLSISRSISLHSICPRFLHTSARCLSVCLTLCLPQFSNRALYMCFSCNPTDTCFKIF